MAGNKQYFHYDHIGNLVQTVNASGDVIGDLFYSPYGEPLGGTINQIDRNQPFGFSTKRSDFASGLVYFGYRFYVPYMERWLNRDPIGTDGGLNIYGYVENNPLIYVDPHGLFLCDLLSQIPGDVDLGVAGGLGLAGGLGVSISSDGINISATAGIGGGGSLTATYGGSVVLGQGGGGIGESGVHISTSATISGGNGIIGASVSVNGGSNGVFIDGSAGYGIGAAVVSGLAVSGTILRCDREERCE